MDSLKPIISVCIPSYNHESYIRETIQSVLDQTFQKWELVIVDDLSTDKTVEIIREFKDPRIRLIVNPRNYGAGSNFNNAVQNALGDYAKLVCGDDLLYPTCLEKQLSVFESQDPQNKSALVCCKRDFVDDQGKKLFTGSGFGSTSAKMPQEVALKRIVRSGTNLIGEPVSVLFRTEAFKKLGGFDSNLSYMIDLDLWCRLITEGGLYFIAEPLCAFRLAKRSWSVRIGRSQSTQARTFLKKLATCRSHGILKSDLWIGCLKAILFSHLRNLLYFYLKIFRY